MTTTTITPNWPRFAAIPWSPEQAAVVAALGLEIPPEGRTPYFRSGYWSSTRYGANRWIVSNGIMPHYVATPDEVLSRLSRWGCCRPTPSGNALHQWLRMWGWVPANERQDQAGAAA